MSALLNRLSKISGIPKEDIVKLSENSYRLYRTHKIKKRSGEKRLICEPSPALKHLQRSLCRLVINKLPVSKFSAAYEKGNKAYLNAKRHIKAEHILKTDIKGFFASITYSHFSRLLSPAYDNADINMMWGIAGYCGGLPMGAPTSPAIANRIMYETDLEISRYLKAFSMRGAGFWDKLLGSYPKLTYSRYSDDLTISCAERIPDEILGGVSGILSARGFILNVDKTRFLGPGQSKRITGIIVQDGGLYLGTRFKKDLKKQIYDRLTKKHGSAERIRGLIAYAGSVDPGFVLGLRQKYAPLGFLKEFYPHAARRALQRGVKLRKK